MALTVKKGENNFPPIEAGTHHAVCYGIIDLGTQKTEWQGQIKFLPKVVFLWELPDITYETIENNVKKVLCKTISKAYTMSLGEKANLRHDLVSWRGIEFTDKELDGFDVFKVLGANCLLQIVHTSKNGKTYANISSVGKLMKNMTKVNPVRELVRYSLEESRLDIPANVPEWIVKKIKESVEFGKQNEPQDDPQQLQDDLPQYDGVTNEDMGNDDFDPNAPDELPF
jgi:hypothetical protein